MVLVVLHFVSSLLMCLFISSAIVSCTIFAHICCFVMSVFICREVFLQSTCDIYVQVNNGVCFAYDCWVYT